MTVRSKKFTAPVMHTTAVKGSSACTAMSCAVSSLQCSAGIAGIYYTFNIFSQATILTLNYYHFRPTQRGKRVSPSIHISALKSLLSVFWIAWKRRVIKKEHEHQWCYTIYILIIKSWSKSHLLLGAHPLFLITLNFVNFLLVALTEVRFSGFWLKKPKLFPYVQLWSLEEGVGA